MLPKLSLMRISRLTLRVSLQAGRSESNGEQEQWVEGDEGGVVSEGSAPPPLLCCETVEGGIPHALERLLDSASCQKPSDCLMLAIHLMLLETGFVPQVV